VTIRSEGRVKAKVTATIGGKRVQLSGPATVEGEAVFTGTVTGLDAGKVKWTAKAGSLTTSGTLEIF